MTRKFFSQRSWWFWFGVLSATCPFLSAGCIIVVLALLWETQKLVTASQTRPVEGFCKWGLVWRTFILYSLLIAKGLGNSFRQFVFRRKVHFWTLPHLLGVLWNCIPSKPFWADKTHFRGFPRFPFWMTVPGRVLYVCMAFGDYLMFQESHKDFCQ